MTIPQEAIEAAAKVHYEHVWSGSDWNSAQHKEIYRRRAQAYLEAALPHIEKEIRAQVAADIWEYWDACGDLIEDRDSARQAIDAIAAQIAEGADHA